MTVPFRTVEAEDERTYAGFLRVIRSDDGFDGALFVVNGKGEPIEFVFSRVTTPRTVLWRPGDLRRRAARELAASLFNVATSRACVLFAKADEIDPGFFSAEIETTIPTCRVAQQMAAVPTGAHEIGVDVEGDELHLMWAPAPPAEDTPEWRLVERLRSAGLLTEPFERVEAGLHEAYGDGGNAAAI